MHLFAIVANNAYLCLVLADEICYGISSLGLEAKDCETAKGLHILLWIKKALTIRFVFWHLEIWTISWLFQTHCSSGRPIYGMNTCHTLIVSWRQALCPVVRMLDRVYYIIKVGFCTARFDWLGSPEPQRMERAQWCKLHSFYIRNSGEDIEDEQVSPAVIKNKESRPFGA